MIWWLPLGAVVSMEAFCTRPFRQASINSPHSPQPSSACLISPLPCPRLNRHASRTRKGSSGSPVSNMRCSSPSCRHQRQPTDPNTVYVPYYNPAVVYGAWSYPAYPPYYFPPAAGYVAGAAIATGVAFGVGYAVGRWANGGNYWGGGCNWGHNDINVNRTNNINVNKWQHNSYHRRGLARGKCHSA